MDTKVQAAKDGFAWQEDQVLNMRIVFRVLLSTMGILSPLVLVMLGLTDYFTAGRLTFFTMVFVVLINLIMWRLKKIPNQKQKPEMV